MCGFTEIELVRLSRLRDQYRAGAVPEPELRAAPRSLAARYQVEMTAEPLGVGEHGVIRYRCLLRRQGAAAPALETYFQVLPTYPAPPDADEVLTWLGGCIANNLYARDLSAWALVCGIAHSGRVHTPPYRGIFHHAPDLGAFALAQHQNAAAVHALLGPHGFRELLREAQIA